MAGYYIKAPSAQIDYAVDWAAGYLEPGESLVQDLGWSALPNDAALANGLQIVSSMFDASRSVITVSGGRYGATYQLTTRMRTSAGRVDERSIVLRIAER